MQFEESKGEIGSKNNLIVLDENGRFVIEDKGLLEIVSGSAKPKPTPSPNPPPPPPSIDYACSDGMGINLLC